MVKAGIEMDVIILNWNGAAYCSALLGSIEAACGTRLGSQIHVAVVDNASTDDSCAVIERRFPWVRLIRNPENLGYAAGNNVGIRATGSPYVVLLNNDTEVVEGDCFDKLVSVLAESEDVAAVGPALLLRDGSFQTGVGGSFLTVRSALGYFLFLSRLFPRVFPPYFIRQSEYARVTEGVPLEWITGAALAVRRDILERVGLVPERYFMYAEDVQLSHAFREAGYRVLYLPTARIMHVHGGSAGASGNDSHWVSSVLDEYSRRNSRVSTRAVQAIMGLGFVARMLLYGFLSRGAGGARKSRSACMRAYARAAFSYSGGR